MNVAHVQSTNAKARLRGLAILTLAMLAGGSILSGQAGAASSGGVGTGGTQRGNADGQTTGPGGAKFNRIWDGFTESDRHWARATSSCESGGDPDAIGGGGLYRGAFQFMKSTWKASPKSPGGDPIAYPYRTQAVVAILLKNRDGAEHWPVCG